MNKHIHTNLAENVDVRNDDIVVRPAEEVISLWRCRLTRRRGRVVGCLLGRNILVNLHCDDGVGALGHSNGRGRRQQRVPMLDLFRDSERVAELLDPRHGSLDRGEDHIFQRRMVTDELLDRRTDQDRVLLLLQHALMFLRSEDGEQTRNSAGTSGKLVLARLVQAERAEGVGDGLDNLDYRLEALLDDTVEHFRQTVLLNDWQTRWLIVDEDSHNVHSYEDC